MKFPYNVVIDGKFYRAWTEINPVHADETSPVARAEPSLEEMSITELRAYVTEHHIKPENMRSKDAIIKAIREAE